MTKVSALGDHQLPPPIGFLERAAHDLRGPAGVTLGALAELEQSLGGQITPAQASLLSMARRGVKRVLAVADQLTREVDLATSKVEAPSTAATVLIVDDDVDSSELLALIAERAGFLPLVAHDLVEAREKLSTHAVDALVTDLTLPDGSGVEIMSHPNAGRLRARIIVSGHADSASRQRSTDHGFQEHFVKPIDGERVIQLVLKLLSAT